jgi:hypothetical protein
MNRILQENNFIHDFNKISPSAKSLLFTKGFTNIPYAFQAAKILSYPKTFNRETTDEDLRFWIKVHHFEERYWSIDQLLDDIEIKNVLELSSGFSFRGLDYIKKEGIYYIDTDLPDVITIKHDLISRLKVDRGHSISTLEVLPLNALDEESFNRIISHFPKGEIAILNEGLLMYLDMEEKKKLCDIINKVLKKRGGYWITGDIYVKNLSKNNSFGFDLNEQFLKEHKIEEKKFDSFESAKTFFAANGLIIDKEATINHSNMISSKYLSNYAREIMTLKKQNPDKSRATWRLKADCR